MINEVKFSQYVDTNEFVDSINLDDFIRRTNLKIYKYKISQVNFNLNFSVHKP